MTGAASPAGRWSGARDDVRSVSQLAVVWRRRILLTRATDARARPSRAAIYAGCTSLTYAKRKSAETSPAMALFDYRPSLGMIAMLALMGREDGRRRAQVRMRCGRESRMEGSQRSQQFEVLAVYEWRGDCGGCGGERRSFRSVECPSGPPRRGYYPLKEYGNVVVDMRVKSRGREGAIIYQQNRHGSAG